MKTGKFNNEAARVGDRLTNFHSAITRTCTVLARILNTDDEIEIEEWGVRQGVIYITFTSPVEIENVPESEQFMQKALVALFPSCRYSGTMVEISDAELL